MPARPLPFLCVWFVALSATLAAAAPFDVYYRANETGNWIFYGGRDTRAAADAAAAELGRSSGFETKVVTFGEPPVRPEVGPAVREAIAVGGASYVRRPGLGYAPGWYRHGGGWGVGAGGFRGWGWGWGGGTGGGWGGGYGGYGGSSSHHHHSSHHHSHEHHSSSHHHSGTHSTPHPSASARGAGAGRGHASSSHHSHTHSHSHSHHSHSHSHGGHHK